MKKARELLPQYILVVFILELFSWHGAICQTSGQASVIEGAKKEGKVVWYATLNINDSNALLHRFEQNGASPRGQRTTSEPDFDRGQRKS